MTQQIPENFIDQSVTNNDFASVVSRDGVVRLVVPFWSYMDPQRIVLPPQPPGYWSRERDVVLRSSVHNEAMWAAAVGICITKAVSAAWQVDSTVPRRARRAQELFLQADTRRIGWGGFLAKHVRDYTTTDNGAFVEIVRATKAYGSQIIGLKHLDSLRTIRTNDPDWPVVYFDRQGKQHALRDYQVIMLCEMPDPGENWNGVGLCAASRAYNAIYKLATIEWYLREKVGGLHPLAIHIVNGLLTNQIDNAVKALKQEEVSKGVSAYMGAVVIGVAKENPPEVVTIPLAELPDRFDRKQEFDISLLTYADALGLDPQELQPLSGQALGTGAQSQVLEDKSKGKGLAAWRQDFTHAINEYVLDDKTTFTWTERDYRDQEKQAAIQKMRADVAGVRIDKGITTPAQELQILVDMDDLPKEFLPEDKTPDESLSDTDKPDQEADAQEGAMAAEQPPTEDLPGAEQPPADQTAVAEKEYTGAMVALFLPKEIAEKLALSEEGALPASDLHITLVYLGDTATDTMDREAVAKVVREIARGSQPIEGVINGQGRFETREDINPFSDTTNAHFLTFDSPSLPAFRQKLVAALWENGAKVAENHGFTPHITLKYDKDKTQPEVELSHSLVTFPYLTLAWGDDRESYPFAGVELVRALAAREAHDHTRHKASDESMEEAAALLAKVIDKARRKKEAEDA